MSARLGRYAENCLPYLATLTVAVFGWASNHAQARHLADSNHERRSDTCVAFESAHRQEIVNLGRTYRFVASLTAAERRQPLNRLIIASIPQMEGNARSEHDLRGAYVPPYCDEPNVGLPENDPPMPSRPKRLVLP